MSAYRSGFDIFDELSRLVPEVRRIVVPKLVKQELAKIARGGGRAGSAARLALRLCSRCEEADVEAQGADEAIVRLAEQNPSCVVCTNDAELKNILKSRGIQVIGVRDYSHLDFL